MGGGLADLPAAVKTLDDSGRALSHQPGGCPANWTAYGLFLVQCYSDPLDGKEGEIRKFLEKEVSKRSLAKIMDVSPTNLRHFIRTRKLAPEDPKGTSKSQARGRRP
jgi:hypothetical protein